MLSVKPTKDGVVLMPSAFSITCFGNRVASLGFRVGVLSLGLRVRASSVGNTQRVLSSYIVDRKYGFYSGTYDCDNLCKYPLMYLLRTLWDRV